MIAAGLLIAAATVATTTATTTSIAEVVVYPDRARVTRKQEVFCRRQSVAAFAGLPAAADPATFRGFSREATVEGLRWEPRARGAARSEAAAGELRVVRAEILAAEQSLERLAGTTRANEQYLTATERIVGQQMLRGRLDLPGWSRALESVLASELEREGGRAAASASLRALKAREQTLVADAAARGAGAARSEYLVELTVSCPAEGLAEVALSYLVAEAGWTPAHVARTREAEGTIELATLATVRQTTGEDWQAARVVLSTALPRQNVAPVAPTPLVVRAEPRDDGEDPRPRIEARSEAIAHAPGASRPAGPAPTGTGVAAAPQGLSVQMVLSTPVLVPGDGQEVRVLLGKTSQPARIHLRAVPAVAPQVFRVAELVNNTPFPLLPAPIDVYRDGSFVGRDELPETPVRGRISLTLGVEERIRVRREIVKETIEPTGAFGRGRRQDMAYRYRIVSHLPRPADVRLADRLPVSELADVRVATRPPTTPGHTVLARDGIIEWSLHLAPGVQQSVDLAFRIDVPAKYQR